MYFSCMQEQRDSNNRSVLHPAEDVVVEVGPFILCADMTEGFDKASAAAAGDSAGCSPVSARESPSAGSSGSQSSSPGLEEGEEGSHSRGSSPSHSSRQVPDLAPACCPGPC